MNQYQDQPASNQTGRNATRDVEALLWLAAGAAWAVLALKALNQTRKLEARRQIFNVSDKLLREVFPNGIHQA